MSPNWLRWLLLLCQIVCGLGWILRSHPSFPKRRSSFKHGTSVTSRNGHSLQQQQYPHHLLTVKQQEAIRLLESMLSPSDSGDKDFDLKKFNTKMKLLQRVTFEDLQFRLRSLNLDHVCTSSKEELLIQYLLYQIDPTIKYSQISGIEQSLDFVSEQDVVEKKVEIVPEGRREVFVDADSADLKALRRRMLPVSSADLINVGGLSHTSSVFGGHHPRDFEFSDSQERREMVLNVESQDFTVYCTQPREHLHRDSQAAVILLPANNLGWGWRSKAMRVLADELSVETNQLVLLPDIHVSDEYLTSNRDSSRSSIESSSALDVIELAHSELRDASISLALHQMIVLLDVMRGAKLATRYSLCGIESGGALAVLLGSKLQSLAALSKCAEMNMNLDANQAENDEPSDSWLFDMKQKLLLTENSERSNFLSLPSKWLHFQKQKKAHQVVTAPEPVIDEDEDEVEAARNFSLSDEQLEELLAQDELFAPPSLDSGLKSIETHLENQPALQKDENTEDFGEPLKDHNQLRLLTGESRSDAEIDTALQNVNVQEELRKVSSSSSSTSTSPDCDLDGWVADEARSLWKLGTRALGEEVLRPFAYSKAMQPTLLCASPRSIVAMSSMISPLLTPCAAMRLPLLVIGAANDTRLGYGMNELRSLEATLANRSNEIFDFAFEIFSGCEPEAFSRPRNRWERALFQAAVHSAALWMSGFSVRDFTHLTMSLGELKLRPETRFAVIPSNVFADTSVSLSLANHELHLPDESYIESC